MGDEVDQLRQELKGLKSVEGHLTDKSLLRSLRHTGYRIFTAAEEIRRRLKWLEENCLTDMTIADVHLELKKGYIQYVEPPASGHEGEPIVIFRLSKFFPDHLADERTVRTAREVDEATSTHDFLKVVVFVLHLAIADLEKTRKRGDGIILIVDLNDAAVTKNFDRKMCSEVFGALKMHFHEVLRRIFILNGTSYGPLNAAMSLLLRGSVSERTQKKMFYGNLKHGASASDVNKTMDALLDCIPKKNVPEEFRGRLELPEPAAQVRAMAKKRGVDLLKGAGRKNKMYYAKEDLKMLNGMQYAGRSVQQVLDDDTALRGVLMREDTDKSGGFFSKHTWKKFYAVLRPEALLLFESMKSNNAFHIVPLHEGTVKRLSDKSYADKAFQVTSKDKRFHILTAKTVSDAASWKRHIDDAIDALKAKDEGRAKELEAAYEKEQVDKSELIDLFSEVTVDVRDGGASAADDIFADPFAGKTPNIPTALPGNGMPMGDNGNMPMMMGGGGARNMMMMGAMMNPQVAAQQQMMMMQRMMMLRQQQAMMTAAASSGVSTTVGVNAATPSMMGSSSMPVPSTTPPAGASKTDIGGLDGLFASMPTTASTTRDVTQGVAGMDLMGSNTMTTTPATSALTQGISNMNLFGGANSVGVPSATTTAAPPSRKTSNAPLAPADVESTSAYGKLWTSGKYVCEQSVNVATSLQSSGAIASVLSASCGVKIVSEIGRTGEVIAAGKLKSTGAVCLIHAKVVTGRGVSVKVRTADAEYTRRTCKYIYSKLKSGA